MARWFRGVLAATAVGGPLTLAAVLSVTSPDPPHPASGAAVASPPAATSRSPGRSPRQTFTLALIGNMPYGGRALAAFPDAVAQINADPAVRWVVHLGDVKDGRSPCSDGYFRQIKATLDNVRQPLVYVVGDNDWADCHLPQDGSHDPLERLSNVRRVFFPHPGRTLGRHPATVTSQAALGLPENVRWQRAGVGFASVDIVGSDNGLATWTGRRQPTAPQSADMATRTAAAVQLVRDTFAEARRDGQRAVVLLMQADMFSSAATRPSATAIAGFRPMVAAIASEAAGFDGQVYLFNGDSHRYRQDQPLAAGSPWPALYGVTGDVPNLTRVTVDGAAYARDYLRVTVDSGATRMVTWTRVPFRSAARLPPS